MTASDEGERDGDHRSPQRGAAAAVEADLTAAVRLIERLRRRLGRLDEADIGSIDGLWPGDRADLAQAWVAVKRAGAKREALEEREADLRIRASANSSSAGVGTGRSRASEATTGTRVGPVGLRRRSADARQPRARRSTTAASCSASSRRWRSSSGR